MAPSLSYGSEKLFVNCRMAKVSERAKEGDGLKTISVCQTYLSQIHECNRSIEHHSTVLSTQCALISVPYKVRSTQFVLHSALYVVRLPSALYIVRST